MSGSKGQEIVYTWARLNTPTHKELSDTIDAALRRAKAEGLEQVSELKKALELYRDASYQGHSSHWDKTGGSGSGCPACLRAIELRAQARQIVDTLDAHAAQIEEGSNEI